MLDWIGKRAVLNHHREVPYRLLKCDRSLSVGEPGSGNLLVEGDNLDALKALLPYYAGQVKCVYIDPPYNTGNENWVYNDAVNSPEIRRWLGKVVGVETEDLSRHDKWLCMMYPRLQLLRDFLRDDGVILVSIDDNELADLMLLFYEVFGRHNHIATLVWQKSKKGDAKYISVTHEYIVLFAKHKTALDSQGVRWRQRKPGVDDVLRQYTELRRNHGGDNFAIRKELMSWYRSLSKGDPRKAHKHYNWSDVRGLYFAADFAGPDDGRENRPRYDILHPVTGKPCAKPATGWRWDEERTQRALAETPPRIHFGADETTIPNRKSYLTDVSNEPLQSVFYRDGRAATREVDEILGRSSFAFPKDTEILADLIALVTRPGDLVLDSFAGSGSTGHAVLKLNERENSQRRFILIELEAEVCRARTQPRLQAAIEGYKPSGARSKSQKRVRGLGGGFRYCRLADSLFDEQGAIQSKVTYSDLAAHIFFTETGEPIPKRVTGSTPFIGRHNGAAYYLLFNGVLGDKRPDGGNVLTGPILRLLPPSEGTRVVYGEGCRLGPSRLKQERIIFKQVPYQIQVS